MKPVAVYTLVRFATFVAAGLVLFGIGVAVVLLTGHQLDARSVRPIALAAAFVAVPVSLVLSYVAFRRQREAMVSVVSDAVERYRTRAAERVAREDAAAEALLQAAAAEERQGGGRASGA